MYLRPFRLPATALTLAAVLAGQSNGPAPAEPVIRVSVDLVQVDATVTDAAGRHVPGLNPVDFEVFEDGKPQRITHFSYLSGSAPASSAASGQTQASPTPSTTTRPGPIPATIQPLPQSAQVSRSVVLMADDLGISFSDMPRIKSAMRKFVADGVQPGDIVSVFASSGGTGALQRFTRDRAQLLAAVERLHWIPGRLGASPFAAISLGDPTIADATARINAQLARTAAGRNSLVSQGTLGSIRYAIQGLASMPGRRALVVVSEGLAYSPFFDDVVDQANRAGVVIDVVDARGVVYYGLTAADDVHTRVRGNPMRDIQRTERGRATEYTSTRNGLAALARGTGGIFIENNNDISAALAQAVADSADYYLIGYTPTRSDYGTAFHSIEVRVRRPGLHVRTRSGFIGSPDIALPEAAPSRGEQISRALLSPFQGDIPLRLRVLSSAGPPDSKTGHRPAILRGRVEIDPKGIVFQNRADGSKTSTVDIAGTVMGVDGKTLPGADQTYALALNPREFDETMSAGLLYQLAVVVNKPGPYQFLVALRDPASGRTGSANAFVEVPDFNAKTLSLSSVELGEVGSKDHIRHDFRPGVALEFAADVYGAAAGRDGKPAIEFAVRLHRGPEQIFTGKWVPMHDQPANSQPIVSGEAKLPAFLPPGNYALELQVRDRLRNKPPVSRWVEFTLSNP